MTISETAPTANTADAVVIFLLPPQTQPFPDKTQKNPNPVKSSDLNDVAPQVRLELTTLRLTAACSTD